MSLLQAVDRLDITVVVDNATDLVSSVPACVESETDRLLAGGAVLAGEALCCPHFGFSVLVEAFRGGRRTSVLFDAGPEGDILERNGARLRVDWQAVDQAVLSHGHWDHAGGLVRALELMRGRDGRRIPILLHPDMFARRGFCSTNGQVLAFQDVPDVAALTSAGAAPDLTREPRLVLDDTFLISGEIPRVSGFEPGLPGHVRRASGDVDWQPDPLIRDERFLAVRLRDRGLLVITACSHAGVINVLHAARQLVPSVPIHGVLGGFHLAGRDMEPLIERTVEELRRFAPARIFPAHCTGWRAVGALERAFGDQVVVPSAVGRRFRLGS